MKALKSRLAETVLADAAGSEQLRRFLIGAIPPINEPPEAARAGIDIRLSSGQIVRAAIVPKATNR